MKNLLTQRAEMSHTRALKFLEIFLGHVIRFFVTRQGFFRVKVENNTSFYFRLNVEKPQ